MNLKMTGKNVLVKPILEQVTDTGIVIKMDFLPKTLKGEVIAISDHPDCSEIKVKDIVFFHKFAGNGKEVKIENTICRVIPITDILGVEE